MGSSGSCQKLYAIEQYIHPLDPNLIIIFKYNKDGELRQYHRRSRKNSDVCMNNSGGIKKRYFNERK
jgi:hypothetical protein